MESKNKKYLIGIIIFSLLLGYFFGINSINLNKYVVKENYSNLMKKSLLCEKSLDRIIPQIPKNIHFISGEIISLNKNKIILKTITLKKRIFPGEKLIFENKTILINKSTKFKKMFIFKNLNNSNLLINFSELKLGNKLLVYSKINIKNKTKFYSNNISLINE